eukprot:CAMPEP_0184042284 /NCGR_PEP_ID=MMETSP0955-20130417/66265_1 /TAXON_ID=627963 /ORGANISM="Aplanochytrium sp, Strain PBS07" /LENGTH=835 /DNA_ID=CAMNT_0026333035 /DNA_START=64 /DNA_END=2568 /DNA_ORIENTATION=-
MKANLFVLLLALCLFVLGTQTHFALADEVVAESETKSAEAAKETNVEPIATKEPDAEEKIVETPKPTPKPTPLPTPKATKASVIKVKAPFSAIEQPTFHKDTLVSWDSSLIYEFLDPLGSTSDLTSREYDVPPLVIYQDQKVNPAYNEKNPKVVFHKDINEFSLNLWLGKTPEEITTYKSQGSILYVNVTDPSVAKVKTVESVDATTSINLKVKCLKDGKTNIVISILNEKITFAVKKECEKPHTKYFMIYTKGGDVVVDNGVTTPAFDVHNAHEVSYIANEDEGEMELIIKSNGLPYEIESIDTKVYEVPLTMLKWISHTRPELESIYNKAVAGEAKSEEDREDDTSSSQGEYEEYEYEETDGEKKKVFKSKEALFVKEHSINPVELHNAERAKAASMCEPKLTGTATADNAVLHASRHKSHHIGRFADLVQKNMNSGKHINTKKILKKLMDIAEGGLTLNIDYHCVQEGVGVVETTLNIKKHLDNEQEFHEQVKLSWVKVCAAKQVKGSDVNLMGFDVRLGAYVDGDAAFYAVRNGRVTNHFKPKSHTLTVSPEERETSFYVSVDPEVWLHEQAQDELKNNKITIVGTQVTSSSKKTCHPQIYGHGARGGEVTLEPMPIVIKHNCKDSGDVVIKVELDVVLTGEHNNERYLRLTWAFTKESRVTPIGFLNIQSVPMSVFDLTLDKTEILSPDLAPIVVKKGKVEHEWRPETYTYELGPKDDVFALRMSTIDSDLKKIKKKGSSIAKALTFEQPHIESSSTSCQVSLRDIGEMEMLALGEEPDEDNFIKSQEQYSISKNSPGYLVIDHKCVNQGHSTITLTLVVEGSQTIMIRW